MQLGGGRRVRWILYAVATCISLSLVFAYFFALRFAGPEWPSGGYEDWARTVASVATPDELNRPLTVLSFRYLSGNLSAECVYRNMNPTHSVMLRGGVDQHGFAAAVTLEAKGRFSFGWRKIGTSPGRRSVPSMKVIAPGDACWFKVNLDPYKRLVERYDVARLVTAQGDFAEFDLKGFRGGPATGGRNIPSPDDDMINVEEEGK